MISEDQKKSFATVDFTLRVFFHAGALPAHLLKALPTLAELKELCGHHQARASQSSDESATTAWSLHVTAKRNINKETMAFARLVCQVGLKRVVAFALFFGVVVIFLVSYWVNLVHLADLEQKTT